MNILQTNKGKLWKVNPGALIFIIVQIKFIAPNKLLIPAICNANIAKSIPAPECPIKLDKGG